MEESEEDTLVKLSTTKLGDILGAFLLKETIKLSPQKHCVIHIT